MNRRAIGTIIAWIFILVAGGMILLLFTAIATDQVQLGKSKLEAQALQQVATILTTQQATSDTAATIPIPPSDIHLTCRELTIPGSDERSILSQLAIGGHEQPLSHHLVAGRDMEADTLTLFTKELRLPFAVGNILYVSNPDELLVIRDVSGDGTAQAINQSLPPEVRRVFTTVRLPASEYRHLQNVRAVAIGPASEEHLPVGAGPNVVRMVVEGDATSGTVYYYNATSPVWEEQYYGLPMLLALIWQGDAQRAECLRAKLGARLLNQTALQSERYRLLREDSEGTFCAQSIYIEGRLEPLEELARRMTVQRAGDMAPAVELIKSRNEGILRQGVTCATIY